VASPVVPMPFEKPHGPSIPDNVEHPHEVFLTLFTEDIVDNIVFQTNLYATQQDHLHPQLKTKWERVIRDLTISLIGKHYRVFFDNYFSLVSLMAYPQENKIYGCGTVRTNRKFLPSDISEDKILRRGETDWRQATSKILCTKWKGQRCISSLSNYHNPDELSNVNKRQKDGF
ncbi:hypothetical protein ILUMI_02947, partial [Ignelater luminosus]